MKNEVIVHKRGRVGYDFAIRQAGGKLVEIGDASRRDRRRRWKPPSTNAPRRSLYFYNVNLHDGRQVPLEQQIAIATTARRSL